MTGRKIVVGVDGSPSAQRALTWALGNAQAGDKVVAVCAWSYPKLISGTGAAFVVPPAEFAERAQELLEGVVAAVVNPHHATIVLAAREGHAARVLLDESKDADLLVVGTRGREGFAGLRLGSVASHCVHHTTVPTVVIP